MNFLFYSQNTFRIFHLARGNFSPALAGLLYMNFNTVRLFIALAHCKITTNAESMFALVKMICIRSGRFTLKSILLHCGASMSRLHSVQIGITR